MTSTAPCPGPAGLDPSDGCQDGAGDHGLKLCRRDSDPEAKFESSPAPARSPAIIGADTGEIADIRFQELGGYEWAQAGMSVWNSALRRNAAIVPGCGDDANHRSGN